MERGHFSQESRSRGFPRPCLMLVTAPMEHALLVDRVRRAVRGGVDLVQVRDGSATVEALAETAAAIAEAAPAATVVINGSACAAAAAGAHGVHLREAGPETFQCRGIFGADLWIGRSVHSEEAAARGAAEGADYLVAGTIFESSSHPGRRPAGLELLWRICASVDLPVLAIGGITPDRVDACIKAGAAGVAVLSAILMSEDPERAAAGYRERLDLYR